MDDEEAEEALEAYEEMNDDDDGIQVVSIVEEGMHIDDERQWYNLEEQWALVDATDGSSASSGSSFEGA